MNKCNDYWCEHYGKSSGKCDRCVKKDSGQDKPDLQVILRRWADKQMGLDKTLTKNKGQSI